MRTSTFFALGVIFWSLFLFQSAFAETGNNKINPPQQPTNYVVIGAFAIHKNAVKFTAKAVKLKHNARFEINKNRNLYYVYVLTTDDRAYAITEVLRLREESPYHDTWVYSGMLGKEGEGSDINPLTDNAVEAVAVSGNENQPMENTNQAVDEPINEIKEEDPIEENEEIVGKKFYFRIYRGDTQAEVEGDVNVIDVQRSRKIGTYVGNKPVRITKPPSKEGSLSLVCEIFGYRKVQYDVNYNAPEGYGIEVDAEKGTVVPFELMRLQKGDHAIMYNVYFFNDAAIMRPESRYEVGSLLAMLQENPKYKIKIHGHTNGNHRGKIISLKAGSDNFFSLNNTEEGSGSAKQLSEERAELIRTYLVNNGIDGKRMQVKAWGGKRAIYDKHHPQAQSNVRVEIEILEN
jgi:outer membrane protein OmpA-like peptidoglycan-associated protein